MGSDSRGARNGTGPFKGSYQAQHSAGGKGRRQEAGEKCPSESAAREKAIEEQKRKSRG